MGKRVYIDAEFNHSSDYTMNVLCFAFREDDNGVIREGCIWTAEEEGKLEFLELLEHWSSGEFTVVTYYAVAEGRAMLSLGFDPRRLKIVDLFIEYRMSLNHNHTMECGEHLVKGKVVHVKPPIPKWEREDGYKAGHQAEISLSSCTYKCLGIQRDTVHKTATRDLILSKDNFDELEQLQIMDYCGEDVADLEGIFEFLYKENKKRLSKEHKKTYNKEILVRGQYAIATALMEEAGYPIDNAAVKAFANSLGDITFQMQDDITKEFGYVGAFQISKKLDKYTRKEKSLRKWIECQGHGPETWRMTDGGQLSLSLDAFSDHYNHRADLSIFGNRFVKYLRERQALNGFTVGGKTSIWDSVGSDGRVRPYFGIYRAQSGRSQPKATGYIHLKAKWMRTMVQPDKGRCMIGLDWGQQEFLIAGLESKCMSMIKAYESGDVYLYTAKLAGAVPWDGVKEGYLDIRDKFKSTVLAIQYLMTKYGLAKKLTTDTKKEHTEDDAQELIDLFYDSYPEYQDHQERIWSDYMDNGYIRLPCGFTMWGDNQNRRSVCNMPTQGFGGSIMRRAVINAQTIGLKVVITLHDALYIDHPSDKVKEGIERLAWCMDEAFKHYFKGTDMHQHANCRIDPCAWSPDFDGEKLTTSLGEVSLYNKYMDPHSIEDYVKYRQYFVPKEERDFIVGLSE